MKHPLHFLVLLLALLLSACATTQNNHDPIEPVNRGTDAVNDGIDRVTLKPLAQGYTAAVPKPMRTAVSNFYDNATYMNTVLNDFLQGKGGQGMQDLLRFLVNSTLGIGGLVDVASHMGLERHDEDLGQTLAVWGFSQGAYIVYPLAGPNSVRNTPDFVTATATDPLFWAGFVLAPYVTIPVAVLKYVDKRARLLDASDMRDELALDPYVFTREAWRQNREYEIHDGNPPANPADESDDWEEDDWEEDDFDSADEEDSTPATRISLNPAPPAETGMAAASATVPVADATTETEMVAASDLKPEQITNQTTKPAAAQKKMYVIFLSSHYSEVEAAAEQGRLSRLGIESSIFPVKLHNRTWYRLRAGEHADKIEAQAHLEKLKAKSGLNGAWLEPVTSK